MLPNSSDPTHFDAIELVNDRAAPWKRFKGGTVKHSKVKQNISLFL